MGEIIKRLPDSVANQIAAGEVIQRPASVVKELVENSVDAGAKSIQIIIKDAGRTLIQVIDDGKGMTPIDARMAFERHATSKISSVDDLLSLVTMGFRGEALPSVASVAQIEMRTKHIDETLGSRILITDSRFERQEPCSTAQGTNIMVKNLFFHLPARRKYLKKDSVELSHILREFEKLALVNPGIEFKIIHNDVTLHQLPAGTLKQRIESLFGRSVGGQLIPIGTETSIVKISGFVGAPAYAKKRNSPQFFFVNGRNMRHRYFDKAVMNCYADLISADSQPSYFINFEVDPSTIDVNVHPQKFEIKFENEQEVWQILSAAIKQALGKANATGAIDFESPENLNEIPVFSPDVSTQMPGIETISGYNPFMEENPQIETSIERRVERRSGYPPVGTATPRAPKDWDKLYEAFSSRRNEQLIPDQPESKDFKEEKSVTQPLFPHIEEKRSFLTIDNRYIVMPSRNGLLMIHRRRAHIRILFDQIMSRLSGAPLQSQRLIFPETITLSPSQSATVSSLSDTLIQLGFEVSFLGDNVWAINAVPPLSGRTNPTEVIHRLVSEIEDGGGITGGKLLESAALSLARASAFNHTSELTDDDTDTLIATLLSCSEPSFTPDGLTIIHPIDLGEIQRLFN